MALAAAGAVCCLAGPVAAQPQVQTRYVSTTGSDTGTCGKSTPCRTISRAVQAAAPGDTILVAGGVYREDVVVTKRLAVIGLARPVIDALGKSNGFMLQGRAARGSRLVGFKVEHATFEGILARQTTNVTIADNVVTGNDLGRNAQPLVGECAGQQQGGTRVKARAVAADLRAGGCGEGLHLLSTSSSKVIDNVVSHNAGGIYLTDEVGPAAHNVVSHNKVNDNVFDCGITLASHSTRAVSSRNVPRPSVAGVYDNTISDNVADRNGLQLDGSGILMGAAFPGGGVYNNLVFHNTAVGNSHPGISIHSHSTEQDLNGNVLLDNIIGRNAVNGGPNHGPGDVLPGVTHTAGILIFSPFSPITGTVIEGNRISNNYFGIWTRLVPPLDRSLNTFKRVHTAVHQLYRPVKS
jgi:parallel beta-helix repeat protein